MRVRTALTTWFRSRHQVALPVRLARRQIFILPTRAGLVFALLVLTMLVASINYTNNLAFLLTFLLASLAVISAVHCYANLRGLEIIHVRQWPVSCGAEAGVRVVLQGAGQARRTVQVRLGQTAATLHLEASGSQELSLHVPTFRRGPMPLGQVVVSTRYPLGLFRAWAPLVFSVQGLVYPRPRVYMSDARAWRGSRDETGQGPVAQSGEFSGVRGYRSEDGMSRVAWKASARGTGLYAKEYRIGVARSFVFDWWTLGNLGYEERISHLAGLVQEAEQSGQNYGLRIPGTELAPGTGSSHAHACLKALALLPEQP